MPLTSKFSTTTSALDNGILSLKEISSSLAFLLNKLSKNRVLSFGVCFNLFITTLAFLTGRPLSPLITFVRVPGWISKSLAKALKE